MGSTRFVLYTSYVVLYVIHLFFHAEEIIYLQGLVGLAVLVVSFFGANRTYQIIAVSFLFASLLLVVAYDISWMKLPFYFSSMALLLSLLYVLPFINHVMIAGRFDRYLYRLLKANTPDMGKLYIRTSFVHYVLALFIFLSSIPLVFRFIKQKAEKVHEDIFHRFASQSMLRSFATVNVWSPIEVYIAMVLSMTGASYLKLLPILFGFSVLMLVFDSFFGNRKYRSVVFDDASAENVFTREAARKLSVIVLFLVLFITSAALLHILINIDFFAAVILTIIPYTMLWAWGLGRFRLFMRCNLLTWPRHIASMQNFMLLFLMLGFFNDVIRETNLLEKISASMTVLGNEPLLLFIFIQLSTLLLALVGIHPLVTVSLQGLLVEPFLSTINPMSISIVMITAVLANDAAGTFNVPITMMNQYMNRNPYQLTSWNLFFALMFGGSGVVLAYILL
jgi:hypothetical protein